MKKTLLTLVLIFFTINTVFAQRDTEHWIAPYFDSVGGYINALYLSTDSAAPVAVKIYNNNTLITTVTISKGNPETYILNNDIISGTGTADAFEVVNKGLYLNADKPFYCSLRLAKSAHAEIITCKGKAGIGKQFYVAAAPNTDVSSFHNFTAGVLATENNTTVTVTWNNPGVTFINGTPSGTSHTFTLNRGQSFIFAGDETVTANLTGFIGAKIVADKPITLTNGNCNGNFAQGGTLTGSDPILDQSVPVDKLGNTFAMVKTMSTDPSRNMEGGIIVATENNTQIFLNGSTAAAATINAGQWYRINESNYVAQPGAGNHSNMFISTSHNVYLYQFVSVGTSDATCGFNYIPPLNCFLPRKIDEIGNVDEMPNILYPIDLKLNILTETGATVLVNGVAPTPAQGPYPLTGNTQWETYAVDNVSGNLTITSTKAVTAGINGGFSTAGYGGYFAGFSSIPLITKTGNCVPGIVLEVDSGYDTYQWYLNGNPIPGATNSTYTPTTGGNYTVKITAGSCQPVITQPFKVFTCLHESIKDISGCSGNQNITPTFTNSTQTYAPGTVTIITPPANGTATIAPNGVITYVPNSGFSGNDQMVYKFCGNVPEFIDCEQVTLKIHVSSLTANNAALSLCSGGTTAVFDLTSAQTGISTATGVTFDYYINQADALAGNANTITTPTAYTSGNATLYVRVKSGGCSTVVSLQLNITQAAVPIISSSSPTICFGGNVTLTSNMPTGNVWSNGATTPSITVTSPGTYTLTNSNGACSSTPASVTLTAEADPNPQISGNPIICGSPATLTASSVGTGNTYTWSTGATGASITASTPGTYTVTVKTPANCEYTKSITVTQGATPTVQNSSLSVCSVSATGVFDLTSAQSNISTTPGVTFDYYIDQADALAGNANTIASPTVYTSGNATIYVRVKSGICSSVASLQLIVNIKPVPVITSSANAICNNIPVILTSSSATGNTWSNGATSQSITVTNPGTYTLTQNNGICTSDPVSVTIAQGVDPNLQITGNLNFCEGSSTILTATANGTGNTFSWSNGTNGATTTVTAPGTYTVTVTTSVGCPYTQSVNVAMDPAITVNIAAPAQITCNTSQITLDATTSIYQPGATFLWTATGGGIIVSGANTLTPVVSNSGTYTLTITSTTPNGCVKQSSVTVIKDTTPPVITLSAPSLKICKGESIIITANGASTYTWTGLPGNGNTQTVSPTTTTTYTVTGIGANGCPATTAATITITVVPEIVSSLHNIEICEDGKGILDAGAGPNYTYSWNTGATTQSINVTTAGTYSVTINNGVCSKIFTATVGYLVMPQISEIIYDNNILTIIAKNNGNTPLEYSIDGGVTWQASNMFSVLKNTQYSIRVRNTRAACDTATEYYTFFMANAITPNGDGINDVIDFSEISKYGNFEGRIFDRYGQTLFTPSTKTPIWDGKYLSRPLPTGTYWYRLQWESHISKKPVQLSGWILLKNRN